MNAQEIDTLAQRYLDDSDNRSDYQAYLLDKDEVLFKKVVFNWACANGYNESIARALSLHISNLALDNYPL